MSEFSIKIISIFCLYIVLFLHLYSLPYKDCFAKLEILALKNGFLGPTYQSLVWPPADDPYSGQCTLWASKSSIIHNGIPKNMEFFSTSSLVKKSSLIPIFFVETYCITKMQHGNRKHFSSKCQCRK